jgi:hypothetical protein
MKRELKIVSLYLAMQGGWRDAFALYLTHKKVEITTTMTTKVIILTAETTQHKVGRYGKRGT